MAALTRVRRILREGRLRQAARNVFRAAIRRTLYSLDQIVVFSIDGPPAKAAPPDLETCRAGFEEFRRCAAEYPETYPPAAVAEAAHRLESGDSLYVARAGGRLAHVAWVRTAAEIAATEVGTERRIPLAGVGGIIYDCWTPPSFRGRGIYPAVLQTMVAAIRSRGMDVWIYCRRENIPSWRGIEKAGFKPRYLMSRRRITPWFASSWIEDGALLRPAIARSGNL